MLNETLYLTRGIWGNIREDKPELILIGVLNLLHVNDLFDTDKGRLLRKQRYLKSDLHAYTPEGPIGNATKTAYANCP